MQAILSSNLPLSPHDLGRSRYEGHIDNDDDVDVDDEADEVVDEVAEEDELLAVLAFK